MKKIAATLLTAAGLTAGLIAATPSIAHAAPTATAPTGYCPGTSATYPWAAGPGKLWQGKDFYTPGQLINRTAVGELFRATVTRTGERTWRIDYVDLPVVDRITAVGGNRYSGTIEVAGVYAGVFALNCN